MLDSLADAALPPEAALIGPAYVAIWLAATASTLVERAAFALGSGVCAAVTLASLAGVVDIAVSSKDGGAVAPTAALGALFAVGGIASLAAARETAIRR